MWSFVIANVKREAWAGAVLVVDIDRVESALAACPVDRPFALLLEVLVCLGMRVVVDGPVEAKRFHSATAAVGVDLIVRTAILANACLLLAHLVIFNGTAVDRGCLEPVLVSFDVGAVKGTTRGVLASAGRRGDTSLLSLCESIGLLIVLSELLGDCAPLLTGGLRCAKKKSNYDERANFKELHIVGRE